jgi:hypothetical protein
VAFEALAAFLENADTSRPVSLSELLETMAREQFTGALTIHFRGGQPELVDFGPPVRVKLHRRVPAAT